MKQEVEARVNGPAGPVRESFLVFGQPEITDDDIAAVTDVMRSRWLGTGPVSNAFEQAIIDYKGGGHAVAVNSCTAALHLSLVVAGVGPGDEVITTPLTFVATVNAIIHTGATPVLADVDPATMNIDPVSVEAAITPRTTAILPVHFAGLMCDMPALEAIARRHDLRIIEDCAHALEAERDGRKAGTVGDFGCFSFYVTKNITTAEGGLVLIKNEEDARRLRALSLHGLDKDAWKRFGASGYRHYEAVEPGFKYNMPDLAAALGLSQFRRVEASAARRSEIRARYDDELAGMGIALPPRDKQGGRHANHLYPILVDPARCGFTRDELMIAFKDLNIGIGVHYRSLTDFALYRERYGWSDGTAPNAARIGRETLSLPLSQSMSDQDVSDVLSALRGLVGTTDSPSSRAFPDDLKGDSDAT